MSAVPSWMLPLMEGRDQRVDDLNEAHVRIDDCGINVADFSRIDGHVKNGVRAEAVFRNLEDRLVAEITKSKCQGVMGCMAWLTNERILQALSQKRFVSLVVQKEDWLRPDSGNWSRSKIHRLYSALPIGSRYFGNVPAYSYASCDELAPVRCVGLGGQRRSAMPRMHHKFMVFCTVDRSGDGCIDGGPVFNPYAVWTGSFNATENGTRSLENAVILTDPDMAEAYRREWAFVLGLSEPLDWSSEWVQPEYRIGS